MGMIGGAFLAAPAGRAATPVPDNVLEFIAPAAMDDVPVRGAAADTSPDAHALRPIVVPLPSGLETGTLVLGGLAASGAWRRVRRAIHPLQPVARRR